MNGTHGAKHGKVSIRCMLALLLGLSAWCLAAPSCFAQPAPGRQLIANVYFEGVQNLPVEKAMNYVESKPGQAYSEAIAQKDIERLAASHLCVPIGVRTVEANTDDGRVNVIFTVRELRSVVKEIVFKHAKHSDVKELQKIARIQRGMPLDPMHNQIACYEIQEHLRTQGYYFANVTLEEGYDERHDRVVFN